MTTNLKDTFINLMLPVIRNNLVHRSRITLNTMTIKDFAYFVNTMAIYANHGQQIALTDIITDIYCEIPQDIIQDLISNGEKSSQLYDITTFNTITLTFNREKLC